VDSVPRAVVPALRTQLSRQRPDKFISRQNDSFCRYSKRPLPCLQGFQGHSTRETLDKMMNGRKSRKTDVDDSDRKHLTGREVERLIEATKGSRNEARDRCLLLLMFRHGLRVSEACGLKLDQVDTESRVLHVARLKGGLSTTQPLRGDELRAVSAWLKERARMKPTGKAFFVSEQRKPLHRSTVNLALRKYSAAASLPLLAHPHMLRHACGFALADQGADTRLIQDYLGHRNIQHTVRYTATNPARFEKLWR
jgi:type 1 fimbriae regulatory protein FimB